MFLQLVPFSRLLVVCSGSYTWFALVTICLVIKIVGNGEPCMAGGTERDWLAPAGLPGDSHAGSPGSPGAPSQFELRPLNLGEILDRTFALYRSHFRLFAGISMVSAGVQVAVQAISLTTAHTLMRSVLVNGPGPHPPPAFPNFFRAQIATWLAALVFFLVAAITQAATSLAMSQVYLNRTTTALEVLRLAGTRWYRWIGIALWMAGSFLWIPLAALVPGLVLIGLGTRGANTVLSGVGAVLLFVGFLGGFPAGFILYLRNALAIPAAVVERLTIRPAMRRSKVLAAGTKGRIFVVLLIAGCLYLVVGVLESPATLLIMFAPKQQHYLAEAITLVLSLVGRTVVSPVALIGLTMVYFDQRVRKEALDLQLLLEGTRETVPPPFASATPAGSATFANSAGSATFANSANSVTSAISAISEGPATLE